MLSHRYFIPIGPHSSFRKSVVVFGHLTDEENDTQGRYLPNEGNIVHLFLLSSV